MAYWSMAELSIYRVAVQARNKPAGTYTYVITRTDDPNWAESHTPPPKRLRKRGGLPWIAFGQRRSWIDHEPPQTPRDPKHINTSCAEPIRGG